LIIKNLKVEEGFFNGLDLSFSQGLNVLVGGRGVGKTSIIELLRFGLAAGNLSSANSNESSAHALSILQSSGRVSIELESNGRLITVSRSATDNTPISTEPFISPIIFSQKEIETIGLNAEGRLSLIDSFVPRLQEKNNELESINSVLRSKSAQLTQLKKELSELNDKIVALPTLRLKENSLLSQQASFEKKNNIVANNQKKLNVTQNGLASILVDIQNIISIKQYFEQKISHLSTLMNRDTLPRLVTSDAIKLNQMLMESVARDDAIITSGIKNSESALAELNKVLQELTTHKIKLEDSSRQMRTEVDSFNEGAGAVLSELGRVKQDIAQLENYNKLYIDKKHQIYSIYQECQNYLEKTSEVKVNILAERNKVVSILNEHLLPVIKTYILPQLNLTKYMEALENCLRGSGLKYKELLSTIVEKVSPAWLLYYSNTLKYNDFAEAIGIQVDRATRLLAYLNERDLASVLTAKIEDKVDFALLDHGSYKNVEELSIGQRCTVSLSVILENPNRILVIDQPEDHLDNEFIAQTLIKSISQRATVAQTILSSHNANIPVLGNASNVVNLESNGRKGFIKCIGSVEKPEIKTVIESIMEGGKDAFQQRSEFYK
jgi:DNA repair exonuclease SbcCD ATPase subunit